MPPVIEEVSNRTAALHYIDKAWNDLEGDVNEFVTAVLDQIASSIPTPRHAEVARLVGSLANARLGAPAPSPSAREQVRRERACGKA